MVMVEIMTRQNLIAGEIIHLLKEVDDFYFHFGLCMSSPDAVIRMFAFSVLAIFPIFFVSDYWHTATVSCLVQWG